MRTTLTLALATVVVTIACSRGEDAIAPASDPPADDSAAQRAVREYVTALTEDNLED